MSSGRTCPDTLPMNRSVSSASGGSFCRLNGSDINHSLIRAGVDEYATSLHALAFGTSPTGLLLVDERIFHDNILFFNPKRQSVFGEGFLIWSFRADSPCFR